ncbi:MAG: hypothetical protein WC025_00350 [Candidatus Magasanikbacteria bacterium]
MGLNILSFHDIQLILMIKLCLVLFFGFGLLSLWKKWHPLIFLAVTGILVCISYLLLVNNLGLSFWGLRGDEVTIAAMFEMFAHGSFFSDFAFPNLVPWYPPLFFWIFAIPGRIFNWNGVLIDKVSVATTFLFFPTFVYLIQAWYWKYAKPYYEKMNIVPGQIAWMLVPLLIFVFVDWDAFILKPYEVLMAASSVMWIGFLLNDLHHNIWSKKRFFVYAISGGIIFMTYYLWLIFGAIAIACSGLFVHKKEQWKFYSRLIVLAVVTLLVAMPFLGPLIYIYHKNGTENWSTILMSMKGLSLYVSMFQLFSWKGLLLLAGFIVLILYRKNIYIRSLLFLFLAGYVWQVMGWLTVLFFSAPIQEFKAFDFYHCAILAFALAFGIEQLYKYLVGKYKNIDWCIVAGTVGLIFLSVNMIFGNFVDDPVVQARRIESRSLRTPVVQLIKFLQEDNKVFPGSKIVEPGVGEIHAFVPLNVYVYFNQHNNHPATRFVEKKYLLESLARESDSAKFYKEAREINFGPIDRFVFFRQEKDSDKYRIYLHIDDFPHGAKDETIDFYKSVFTDEKYFSKVFENSEFVVFDLKN